MNKDLEIMNHIMQNWMKGSEKYNSELFHFQPEGNEWSLQQVLLHMAQIQDFVGVVLKKQLTKQDELRNTKLKNWYRYIMLKLALASSKKFKAPKIVSIIENDISLGQIKENWNQSYTNFVQFMKSFPKDLENKLIYKHPVIGWININQTLGFMLSHMKHHQKQIESLYSQLDLKMK